LTSRERMVKAIKGERPDRLPVSPWGFGVVDPESDLGRELVAACDMWLPAGGGGFSFFGARLERETVVEEGQTTIVFHTPGGDLTARRRSTDQTSAQVEFPCKGPDDVARLLAVPYEPTPLDLTRYFEMNRKYGEEGLVCLECPNAVCWPAETLSPEDFCLLWADHPELMIEMVRVASARVNDFIEKACRAGVDCFRIIGGEYVTVQLGPRAVESLLEPFDSEQIAIMHRYGAIAHYHNHGPMMRYLEPLAALGMDSMDPFEAPPWGDCDLGEAARRLAGRVCIVGNLDDMEVVDKLPADRVLALARERVRQVGEAPFILSGTASGRFGPRAARNFIALAEAAAAGLLTA